MLDGEGESGGGVGVGGKEGSVERAGWADVSGFVGFGSGGVVHHEAASEVLLALHELPSRVVDSWFVIVDIWSLKRGFVMFV